MACERKTQVVVKVVKCTCTSGATNGHKHVHFIYMHTHIHTYINYICIYAINLKESVFVCLFACEHKS